MKRLRTLLLLCCLLPFAMSAQQSASDDTATQTDGATIAASAECDTDAAFPIPDKQPFDFAKETRLVIDQPGVLDPTCAQAIRHDITQLEQDTGAQLRVLIVGTIGDQSIEEFANDTFHTWKLGRAGKDDGVLIVIAQKERRVRIEVGYGLEGRIPDGATGDILRSEISPNLRAGTWGKGLSLAVNDLAQRIRQEEGTRSTQDTNADKGTDVRALVYFLFLQAVGIGVLALGTNRNWKWALRLLLPVVVVEVLALLGLPFGLTQSKQELVALVPVTLMFCPIGYPIGRSPLQSLYAIGRMTILFATFGIVLGIIAVSNPGFRPLLGNFFVVDGMFSVFFGLVWTVMRGAHRTHAVIPYDPREQSSTGTSSSSRDDDDSSSSSSSSDDSGSSSSDDSSSDSGGGGGDSGGGGASDSF